jgi:hypothetical protein
MNAYAVIPFNLSLFVRDYFLLGMGPTRLLSAMVRLHAVVVLASVLLVSGAIATKGGTAMRDAIGISLDYIKEKGGEGKKDQRDTTPFLRTSRPCKMLRA